MSKIFNFRISELPNDCWEVKEVGVPFIRNGLVTIAKSKNDIGEAVLLIINKLLKRYKK